MNHSYSHTSATTLADTPRLFNSFSVMGVIHAGFGLVAYVSVVFTLLLSVPIFLLGLDASIHPVIPQICDLSITKAAATPLRVVSS